MKRCATVSVVSLLALVAVGIWMFDDGFRTVHSETLSEEYHLLIRGRDALKFNRIEFKITYHHPPAMPLIGMFVQDELSFDRPWKEWSFSSIHDIESGIKIVYDNNNAGFVLMFYKPDRDLWHNGRDSGWAGSERQIWESRFEKMKTKYPEIPYTTLPSRL